MPVGADAEITRKSLTMRVQSADKPSARLLHQLFEAQVERDGKAIAVECHGHDLNYLELNTQANRLAHYLISRGVTPDDRIALCVERSTSMIVAILGILKAGCAYVPLDPVYSSQRLTHILKDANPIFLLADTAGRKVLGEHRIPVIELDQSLPDGLPIENPNATNLGVNPTNLAYIIYTSGSTGTPKGVMVEHRQIVRLFEVIDDILDFNKEDKWCLFHSFSFDVSVWEMWGAFSKGGQLSIVSYDTIRSPDEFHDWIKTRGITVLNQTPSAFKAHMWATNNISKFDRLRYVIFSGEGFDPLIAEDWWKKYDKNGTALINMYGLTETVHTTYQRIECLEDCQTIGRPLSDLCIYLLDVYGDPVPLGAEGELYIGGAGVARGYLNRPELTAERFLSDPFSDNPAARMYRTGDRARYLPDGNLVYLGRNDQQVKIRGFRIELGEIEAHLVAHPQVREAVVQFHGNEPDARLVAYVVFDADRETLIAQHLRDYLSNLLPNYMVPAAYVCLPSLPLTTNGKLDRRALPTPNDETFARQQYETPHGEMEEKLAKIWRELLKIEQISRYDNFFALGGNSLLVARLMAQLRQIGLDTTVREVFNSRSLATLAATLTRYQAVNIPTNLITEDSTKITPEMLPLISLSQAEIDAIIAQVPGGVSNIQDIYGLAPLQSGMLFHHIRNDRVDPYLLIRPMCFTDHRALEQYSNALQHVMKRHDILRTVYIWEGLNEPAQVVLRQVPPLLTEITLGGTDESILEQLSRHFNLRHFRLDLRQAPLLRLMAAPTSEGGCVALQLTHHIIVDHSTWKKMIAEVNAIMNEKFEELRAPNSFRYIVAQTRLEDSPDEHRRFFTKMLGDIDEPTLPFGLSDVSLDEAEINQSNLMVSQTLSDRLREHARDLHVSLASLCHLAWAQVLASASGREAVVFGTVVLGRFQTGEGNNDVMGPVINNLPIRIDVDESSVKTAVRHTHARLSALLTHEHAPLVLAQRCSGCPASVPLFSAILNYRHNQKTGQVAVSLPGVTSFEEDERTNYPLVLSIDDDGDSLVLTTQVVSPLSTARICGYIQQALQSLADALEEMPPMQLRALQVIPPEERTLLLHTWNRTSVTNLPDRCLHQLFESQVECDGESIAVECNGDDLSYSEVNAQANRLAHYLIARGVKPDDRIALCVKRSTKLIVAILGILKAGGAYVPLDPNYSSQRMTSILKDSDPTCLLIDPIARAVLEAHEIPVVELKESLFADYPTVNPDPIQLGLTSSHLAYIIYTSGSTGVPKGVMVEHRNATNCIYWVKEAFRAEDFQHTSFSTSVNFDISLYECFAALSMGTTLHILPNALAITTSTSSNITMLSTVPSAVTTILNTDQSLPTSLRTLHLMGEPLKNNLIERIFTQTHIHELYNLYGLTETSFLATMHRHKRGDEIIETIGRPIANTQIYLLDVHGKAVPLGAEGELYIGGANVARGYLKRPELTAERFLPDPFNDNPAARMYRTGDRARYLPNGNLVYLGRIDQQVKVRGFRIELGEIEAHLAVHPEVHETVVQPYSNGPDTQLVAYVVTDSDKSLVQNLRIYLSSKLPEYMVPAAYVFLSSLPLTPNGKLDRRALPAPRDDAFSRQQYEAPQGELEEKLADIWRDLLSIDCISRHDNFFELGGHSLMVMHFINKAKLSNLHINADGVFFFPILKDLADQIAKRVDRLHCDVAIPVRQYGNETPLFLLADGKGDISYAFELAREIDKMIPVYALPWSSPENKQPSSIEEMAGTMITAMKKICANGPFAIAGYSSGGILAYEMVKQLIDNGNTVSFLGLIDTYSPSKHSYTEMETFLFYLMLKFPIFKTINDSEWWTHISKLSLSEAIKEIKNRDKSYLKNMDVEWEASLSKQRHNYQNMCASSTINALTIKIHLFKALDYDLSLHPAA